MDRLKIGHVKKDHLDSLKEAIDSCVKKSNDKAKEFIYKRYYGYLMAVILRYVKDPYDAEELVNESFMKAFKGMPTFKATKDDLEILERSFLGWMARIATNLSIDHLRAKKQIILIENQSDFEAHVNHAKPSTSLEVADILKLLEELPEIQRLIFNLFEVDGYSHEEISEKLNIPVSTSRTYLTRAKKRLRTMYRASNNN